MATEFMSMKPAGLPLSQDLFLKLQSDILKGIYKNGEKISEQKVCDIYGISRTPVREAFRLLESAGLIETIPNRGAFVVGLSDRDIEDLFEMRKAYEILAIKWAIERATKKDREKIEEAYEFMEFYTLKKDREKVLNINRQFHSLIYSIAGNRMLESILTTFQQYLKEADKNNSYSKQYLNQVLVEHKKIWEAFMNKDSVAGVKAVTEHLDNAKKRSLEK